MVILIVGTDVIQLCYSLRHSHTTNLPSRANWNTSKTNFSSLMPLLDAGFSVEPDSASKKGIFLRAMCCGSSLIRV